MEFPALPSPALDSVPLSIEAFLATMDTTLTVDVRSPAEFEVGHIPGAVNLPLFDDEARAVVGTDFKRKGRYEAIRKGLQLAGPNFAQFLDALQEQGAKPGSRLLVYCWRGGMRSGSMGWLFSLCGYQVQTLHGGYRSFRRWCKTMVGENAAPPASVIVLGGCTGVGKTAILHELRARGEQVLDLEGLANHRGSAFGAVGQAPQPSNEAYENHLAFQVRRVSSEKPLWIEHESRHVGKVLVPFGIQSWVSCAPKGAMVVVSMRKELRVSRLVEDYCGQDCREQLKECISSGLAKRLGGQRVKEALKMLDEDRWSEVASMMLEYYDKLYERWADESLSARINVECPTEDAAANAERVLQAVRDLAPHRTIGLAKKKTVLKEKEKGNTRQQHRAPSSSASSALEEVKSSPVSGHRGACFCGEVQVHCTGEPKAVSYCHCSICRRLSGAPFSSQAIFPAEQVELTLQPGASLSSLRTSKGVERSRCTSCMAPVRGLLLGGKMAAVPLSLEDWRPMHHLHYGDRVMDVRDGLPKYLGAFRSSLLAESEW
ncbi:unnamed protein product [Effrenium voratum]|nr:unnamed protein product [Effrenium voratum]